jgi:hypothetical protein
MPRHKISIEEALKVIKRDKPSLLRQDVAYAREPDVVMPDKPVLKRIGTTTVVITLHAQHSIGCGGSTVVNEAGDKGVVENTYMTYGPGVVTVSSKIAGQLLHQDMLARQADERLLETRQRSYLVMERRGNDGLAATVGFQVDDKFFGESFGLNSNFSSTIL